MTTEYSTAGEQRDCVGLPDAVSMNRAMVALDGSAVDGYKAEFIGIEGAGHDREEALEDLFSEIETVFAEFDGIVQDAAAVMDGTADDLENNEETPVRLAERLREDASEFRRRADDV